MTEQTQTVPAAEPPPAAPQRRRTLGIPLVIGIAAATFLLGGLLGTLVGGVVGYAIGDDHGPDVEHSRIGPDTGPQQPGRPMPDLPDQVPDGE
jgi:hypothetical protein